MLDRLSPGPGGLDDDEAFLVPGSRFGRYTLVRRLAVGGMAEIHLAVSTGLSGFEKMVVLKRILPQFAENDEFVAMFLDEARLAATLDHPNIVQVHDVGMVGRSYFMAMEYLQGTDVRNVQVAARKHKRPLGLGEALSIVIPTAAGLHYAH
jgi:serine/threonine-protein kinase